MGNTRWTDEQWEAITDNNGNLLVAAAAGAGKTAVLVERIIRKITCGEKPLDIDRLLVVTFTNAAATEMRERIGDAISKALENDPENRQVQRQMTLWARPASPPSILFASMLFAAISSILTLTLTSA